METTYAVEDAVDRETPADDAPSRALTRGDHYVAAAVGALTAGVMVPVALAVVQGQMVVTLTVLAAGLGYLGWLDRLTHMVRNRHTAALGAVVLACLLVVEVAGSGGVLVPALVGGAGAFTFMLVAGVVRPFAGGGDIKLVPVPAAVMTALSPWGALLWLWLALTLCLAWALMSGARRRPDASIPMVPFMAAAAVVAVPVITWVDAITLGSWP